MFYWFRCWSLCSVSYEHLFSAHDNKTFNDKNEEMEEEEYRIAQLKSGGLMNAPSRRKSKPLPPYWGSGYNRQIVEDDVSLLGWCTDLIFLFVY